MKKLFIFLASLGILLAGTPAAASLYSYYHGQLPSLKTRATTAATCGITSYTGTATENNQLESCLTGKPILGATVGTKYVQTQYFTLYGSGAVLGSTSIIITKFQDIDGNNLAMSDFGNKGWATIEPNNGTQEEQISFTGVTQNSNGTATLTGVSHVGFKYPYTETSGTSVTHPGGSKFVISNTVGFYNSFTNKFNDEIVSSTWTFATNTIYFSKNNRGSKFFDDGTHLGWSDDGINTFTFAAGDRDWEMSRCY